MSKKKYRIFFTKRKVMSVDFEADSGRDAEKGFNERADGSYDDKFTNEICHVEEEEFGHAEELGDPKTTCGGCGMFSYDHDETENWTYPWINILLCDDCYTQARMAVADQFNLNLIDIDM